MVAAAIGTAAGVLVDSRFAIRQSVIDVVLHALGPAFDLFSDFPNVQLLLSAFIERVPVILAVGMAVGFVVRFVRFRVLMFWCALVWPAFLLVRRLVSLVSVAMTDGGAAAAFFASVVLPEGIAYAMQYALLFVAIHGTVLLLEKDARRPVPA